MKRNKIMELALAGMLLVPGTSAFAAGAPLDITTWAGQGVPGYADSTAAQALFRNPTAAVLAPDGTLYVSDTANNLIRTISPKGVVTTLAGVLSAADKQGRPAGGHEDGDVGAAKFNRPMGMALDARGTLFVADAGNGAIRAIDRSGYVSTVIKGLNYPTSVAAAPNGDLYVSETLSHRILIVSAGKAAVLAGGGAANDSTSTIGNAPAAGGFRDGKALDAAFNQPAGIALASDGTLYVADSGNQRIRKVTPAGDVTTVAGSGLEFDSDTASIVGGYMDGDAQRAKFHSPQGLSLGSDNTIYVADTYNHLIRKITAAGKVETIAGAPEYGKRNGSETQARFNGPTGIVVKPNGDLLIVDQWNDAIREVKPYSLPAAVLSEPGIRVVVDGKMVRFSIAPQNVNNRVFVPLRDVAEQLGYHLEWDQERKTAVIGDADMKVVHEINIRQGDGTFVKDGRTMVSIRRMTELLDLDIYWMAQHQTVVVRS